MREKLSFFINKKNYAKHINIIKKQKIWISFLFLIILISFFYSCTNRRAEEAISGTRTYKDFVDSGKRFGVEAGDVYGSLARELFVARSVTESINIADLLRILSSRRIDAIIVGHQYLPQMISSGLYADFEYLWVPSDVFLKEAAFVFHTEELRDQYNEWFYTIVSDGTYQLILDRWLGASLPRFEDIPVFEFTGVNGILRIADTGNYPPLSYLDPQGNPIGFGAEMISRFAQHIDKRPEFSFMPYEAITHYVVAGNADMSAATKSLEDERRDNLFFGEPSLVTRAVLIVRRGEKIGVDINDFIGERIAVLSGAFTYTTTQNIGATPIIYQNTETAIDDVRNGRVFGFMESISFLRAKIATTGHDIYDLIPIPHEIDRLIIAAISNDQVIIDSFDLFLNEMEKSGILQYLQDYWFTIDFTKEMSIEESRKKLLEKTNLDDINLPLNIPLERNLKVAISAEAEPFVYKDNTGEFSGYSVDIALLFGEFLGREVEFVNVSFQDLLPLVENSLVDISIDRIGITTERQKRVLFSKPIYEDQCGILVLRTHHQIGNNTDYTNFIGRRIGVSLGSLAEAVAQNLLRANTVSYLNYSAGIEDIRRGRIDGYMTDLVSLNLLERIPENHDLIVHEVPSHLFKLPMGAFSTNQDVINRFNNFLEDLDRREILTEIQERWFSGNPDLDADIISINTSGRNGVLRVATCSDRPPYSFLGSNGRLNGYSIELARLFAAHEDMIVRFSDMEFSSLIPFVMAGRADIGLANVSITEERRQSVIFSEPVWYDTFGIIALRDDDEMDNLIDDLSLSTPFMGQRIGVMYGTVFDKLVTEVIRGIPVYYYDYDLAVVDFNTGRISGFMLHHSVANLMRTLTANAVDVHELYPTEMFITQTSAISIDPEIINNFNQFLQNIREDGTLVDIKKRWIRNPEGSRPILPDISESEENGILRLATSGKTRPFSYFNINGELVGYGVEIAKRFAYSQRMGLEVIHLNLHEITAFVESGRADIGIDVFQSQHNFDGAILFSDPIYEDNAAVISLVKHKEAKPNQFSLFISWFKNGIRTNFIVDNRWRLLLEGFQVTLMVAVLAQILGTILGSIIAYLLSQKNIFLKWIGNIYYEFINRIPIVMLLLIAFYIMFSRTSLTNIQIAIIVFTMLSSMEVAKVLKKSFSMVNKGEIEAAKSLGFSSSRVFISIVYPQVLYYSISDYTKSFINLLKTTAILGYIAIMDLTRAVEIIRSRTFDPFFPLVFATLIYFILITLLIYFFKYLVKRIQRGIVL
ncbi:MAG: transporter substrate-binding domain-containing protein [Candidatus Cloacimonetes bacterium]|nr:transporter substrate-binding domain-containing protein [Candidatus Cloacimonadota bacterium]